MTKIKLLIETDDLDTFKKYLKEAKNKKLTKYVSYERKIYDDYIKHIDKIDVFDNLIDTINVPPNKFYIFKNEIKCKIINGKKTIDIQLIGIDKGEHILVKLSKLLTRTFLLKDIHIEENGKSIFGKGGKSDMITETTVNSSTYNLSESSYFATSNTSSTVIEEGLCE
jgi:hypothetical protein